MPKQIVSVVIGVVVLGIGGWWLMSPTPLAEPAAPAGTGAPQDLPPRPTTPRAAGPAGWSIEPAETVAIDSMELPATGVVTVDLVLGEPSRDAEPLSGRILSIDPSRPDRVRELSAEVIGARRGSARIEVAAEFLTVDTYLIEIRTTDRSHFPLRRYRLEVR